MAAPQLIQPGTDPEKDQDFIDIRDRLKRRQGQGGKTEEVDIEDDLDDPEEEVEEVIEYGEPEPDNGQEIDAREDFERLNKRREKQKEQKEAKEQERLRTDESKKPPKQEPKPDSPELKQKKTDKAKSEADKIKSTQSKLNKGAGDKATSQGGKAAGNSALSNVAGAAVSGGGDKEDRKERLKEAAKQEAKEFAKKIARQVGQALKKAAVSAIEKLAASPPGLIAIGIILLFIIIFAVVFALFGVSGDGGKGPAIYPETALEQQQSNYLVAVSGDKIAQDTIIKDVIESELARYDRVEANARTYNPELTASVVAKKAEFDVLLNSALAEQNPELRREIISNTKSQMKAFESTLPFGSWIATMARDRVGQPNLQFCSITGADAKVACASFTSTVMYLAGIPNAIVATTADVWNNSFLSTVIDRSPNKSRETYDSSVLKPGDIIWWGDGTCSSVKYDNKIFDHVGFYIGDGKTADTSSSAGVVVSRNADKIDSCRLFNGAKRYGS